MSEPEQWTAGEKTPDEASEMAALVRALSLASDFKLLFVRYRGEAHRQRLRAALMSALPRKRIQKIRLDKNTTHLLDVLRAEVGALRPDGVFVSGFDLALPTPETAEHSPLVANLNAARDLFPRVVRCPLVLWVPEYVLVAIARGAPDFFSVRSGAYQFEEMSPELEQFDEVLTELEKPPRERLKLQALTALRERLTIFAQHPQVERDTGKEADLLARIGRIYQERRRWQEASECYQDAIQYYGDAAPERWRAEVLLGLGDCQRRAGSPARAQQAYQAAQDLARRVGDRDLVTRIERHAERLRDLMGRPFRVLFLAANPKDTARLGLGREFREVSQRIARSPAERRIELQQEWAVRATDLVELLTQRRPDIVHFSGHGTSDGHLVFEDDSGESRLLPIQSFGHILRLLTHRPSCVVLNVAFSSNHARPLVDYVDCVIAIKTAVEDELAIQFSASFYEALALGSSLANAFSLSLNRILSMRGAAEYQLLVRPGMDPNKLILIPRAETA